MEFDILSVWEDRLENITCHGNDSCKFNFIGKKKDIAVPYLIFISFLTFVGTFGNALVLGALVINKVRNGPCFVLFVKLEKDKS